VTQPTFVPITEAATVRPSMATPTPEIGRPKKAGLLGRPSVSGGPQHGSTGPDGGYALTLAERALATIHLEGVGHHDALTGVALLAARRAASAGRSPASSDVEVAVDLLGLRSDEPRARADARRRLTGIAHDYSAQRRFVDDVPDAALRQRPGQVTPLSSRDS
jgi:hypothetical protein